MLDIVRGRPRQHGRAAPIFSSPHPSVPFLSRPGTHPHAFSVPRSTPGAHRRGGLAGTNELPPSTSETTPACVRQPDDVPEPPQPVSVKPIAVPPL